jgi:beta-lactamase class D
MKTVKLNSILFFVLLSFQACTVNNVREDDGIGEVFEANKVVGTFGMFDNSRGDFTIYDLDRFKKPVSPAQTFHIFHTLVALHTGKLADDSSQVVANDSTALSLSIYQGFRKNSVPHFQTLSAIIGKDTLKYWMDSVKYGNKKIGNELTQFWMNDSLTISPDEQLGLIKRLYFRQHPFRASVQEQVKKMMVVVNNAQYQMAYQLGVVVRGDKKQAWVVGWIEENRHVYPFVVSYTAALDADTDAVGKKLSEDILAYLGFFKGIM